MNPRIFIRHLRHSLRLACLLGGLCMLLACREQKPEPRHEPVERPAPVEEAAPAEAASGTAPGGAGAGGAPGEGQMQGQPGTEHYLPPSEQGADVQITETPVDGSAAPEVTAETGRGQKAPAADGQPSRSAGTGGAVPADAARQESVPPSDRGAQAHQGANQQTPAASVAGSEGLSTTAAGAREDEARALEEELQRKMQQFDSHMQKAERAATQNRAGGAGVGSSDSAATAGRGGLLERPAEGTGAGGRAGQATGLGSTPDLSGETSGSPRSSAGGPSLAPAEAADDDIVARQLREAAEREVDPVLREKLWREYRSYKDGL